MKEIIQLLALSLLITSCQSNTKLDHESSSSEHSDPAISTENSVVRLDEPFFIKEKSSVPIEDESGRFITFTKVIEDSLCPHDFDCFRWGNMVIQVQIDDQSEELSLGDMNLPQEATFGDLKVTLLDLNFPVYQQDKASVGVVYEVSLKIARVN